MNHMQSNTAPPHTFLAKLGHLARFVVFLCTAGWLFPHACTEGMDLTQIQDKDRAGQR
jgi:hypothetical protein